MGTESILFWVPNITKPFEFFLKAQNFQSLGGKNEINLIIQETHECSASSKDSSLHEKHGSPFLIWILELNKA